MEVVDLQSPAKQEDENITDKIHEQDSYALVV